MLEENRILELLEFWKMKFLWIVGKERNKGKGKRKRNSYEEIFSWNQKVKLFKRLIPRFESRIRKTFRKILKSSRNQASRNDSYNLPKINNNILRLMVKFVWRNNFIVLKLKIPESVSYRLRWNFHKIIKYP